MPPWPLSPLHFRASTLFGPQCPPLLGTVRSNKAKQKALRSALFGRMEALHSVWPIRPNKTVFVRSNRTRGPLFGSDWPNGKSVLGRCQGVGRRCGPKRGTGRRPVPRSGGMLRKGKETGAAPKSRGAREEGGDEKGREGDEGGIGEEGVLGKGEEKGWRRRGRKGRRLGVGCREKRGG